jgi:hypothetical protein
MRNIALSMVIIFSRQVTGLRKIAAFCKDSNLHENRQAEIRDRCLKFWKIPDAVRKIPPMENPKASFVFQNFFNFYASIFPCKLIVLT